MSLTISQLRTMSMEPTDFPATKTEPTPLEQQADDPEAVNQAFAEAKSWGEGTPSGGEQPDGQADHAVSDDPGAGGTRSRPFGAIRRDLQKHFKTEHLDTKKQGGATLTFCPWYRTQKYLDHYTNGGWSFEITEIRRTSDRIFLVGRLTIHASEGDFHRCATGTELLKKVDDRTGEVKELPYGDPSSNAESMAFRRCCARFGLGLYLYDS